MAIENFADLVKLAQQKAFYDAGGGRTPEGTQWGQALTGVGQGLNQAAQGLDTGLELRKKALEQQRIGNIFGAPTPQAVQGQQSTYVAPNIFPQPTEQQENGQMTPSSVPSGSTAGQQPISPFAQKYNQVQGSLGLSPETPVFQAEKLMPEITNMSYKQAVINNLGKGDMYVNPNDYTDVSPTKDATHTFELKGKDAASNALKSQLLQQNQEIAQAKQDLANSKTAQEQEFTKQKLDLMNEHMKILSDAIMSRERIAGEGRIQRASGQAMQDQEKHPVRDFFFGKKDPSSYLNSADQSQDQNDPLGLR